MKSILKDLKIEELIAAAEAEMKEKQEKLDFLWPRLALHHQSICALLQRVPSSLLRIPAPTRMCSQVKWRPSRRAFWNWKVILNLFTGAHLTALSSHSWRPSRRRSGRSWRSSARALTRLTQIVSTSSARPVGVSYPRLRRWPLLGFACTRVRRTHTRSLSA